MEAVVNGLFMPFADMADDPVFFLEVIVYGLMAGVMYSLVALGFVLIFKASGVFNFAQGVMVLFAALTLVGFEEILGSLSLGGIPPMVPSLVVTVAVMVALAVAIERLVLRPLGNQPDIILFMSTIGIAFFLEGFGGLHWGGDVKPMPIEQLGVSSGRYTIDLGGGQILIQHLELTAAVVAGVLVAVLAIFFQKTRIGRALRAVADDHQAALSVGIPLKHIWVIVWSVAGVVALAAGVMWGANSGVQF